MFTQNVHSWSEDKATWNTESYMALWSSQQKHTEVEENQVTRVKDPMKRANKKGQGRKITYSKRIEEKLLLWILEKQEQESITLSTQAIRLKAASEGWVRKFLKRNKLVLRVCTHISQKLPKDLEDKIKTLWEEVKKFCDYP